TVLAPDLLGVGEMVPENASIRIYLRTWYASMLIGRSILGVQAGDVVRLTNLLKKNLGINEVYGLARKELAPVLLHAAAFDPTISRIALIEPYSSYNSVAMSRLYDPKFINSLVSGAVKFYDLPDLAASLAPRKLIMIKTTDGSGNIDPDNVNKDLKVIKDGYHYRHADDALTISGKPAKEMEDIYRAWIK
ncbi:MAG: xylan esterase, partial [Ginsengibacter sp.]